MLLIFVFVAVALLLPLTAWSQRIALVVGNAAYTDRPLRNPVNDARLMQATLRDLGFEVQVATDVDRRGLLGALRDFEARARSAEVALFYFAGHGAQVGGANYLIPLNAPIRSETDVPDEAVDASSVLRRIEEGRARVGLVILDACRDNPYPGANRSSTRGLARMSVPTGTIVAYATAPGSTAEDGSGDNGTYTEALARYLASPGLDIKEVFDRTAQEVERVTNGKQRPREEIGLRGRFVLRQGGATPGLAAAPPVVAPAPQIAGGGVSLTDLERIEQARRSWAQWQQQMQADFDRIVGFQGGADLRVQAWQRFLDAWKDDNPTSDDDEGLRVRARQGLGQAQAEAQRQQRLAAASPPAAAVGAAGSGVAGASQTFKDCEECPEMVVIPAGRFLMGSPPSEAGRSSDEGPQRWVDVPRFAMGKFEVTQRQWVAVMGSNPSRFEGCGPDCPVEKVSWNDAQEFVRRLSQRTGHSYRLPSEAEWEYSARAGTTTAYFWGDAFDAGRANKAGRGTVRVGSYGANAFGLHDMHGNVWEWVQDVWHGNYAGAPSDGSAWTTGGDQSPRVVRGGSWGSAPQYLRSADSYRSAPDSRYDSAGFRIARTFSVDTMQSQPTPGGLVPQEIERDGGTQQRWSGVLTSTATPVPPDEKLAVLELFGQAHPSGKVKIAPDKLASVWFAQSFTDGIHSFHAVFFKVQIVNNKDELVDCYACVPEMAILTYKLIDGKWITLSKQTGMEGIGSFGDAPNIQRSKELPLSRGRIAFLIEHGYMAQGQEESGYQLIGFHNGKWSPMGYIVTQESNSGNCREDIKNTTEESFGFICYGYRIAGIELVSGANSDFPDILVTYRGSVPDKITDKTISAPAVRYRYQDGRYEAIPVVSITGDILSRDAAAFDAPVSDGYAGSLMAAIRPNIVFTERLAGHLAAEVEVTAERDGRITGRRISKSSGRRDWDEAVLRAVDRTRELPKDIDGRVPPEVVIVFRPND